MAVKRIEIRIAATGADQAAAEMRKVEAAMGTIDDGSTKATAGLQGFVKEAPRVSAAGLNAALHSPSTTCHDPNQKLPPTRND